MSYTIGKKSGNKTGPISSRVQNTESILRLLKEVEDSPNEFYELEPLEVVAVHLDEGAVVGRAGEQAFSGEADAGPRQGPQWKGGWQMYCKTRSVTLRPRFTLVNNTQVQSETSVPRARRLICVSLRCCWG